MPLYGEHVDAPTLIGSWPIIPSVVSGTPTVLPQTMRAQATILGILREPSAGFDVAARSFVLNVDGTDYPVGFVYGSPLPLSVVISQINTAVGAVVAYDDNRFLRLQSPTTGDSSYLKVESDPASSPTDVLKNLGLFAEVEARAGDLTSAAHIDPDRQVATPGQMTVSEGENLEARVFNRALAQLAINNDRSESLLSKTRVAVQRSFNVVSYTTPGTVHGVQITGGHLVYVGKASAPSIVDLEKLFAVLDSNGLEFTKDIYTTVASGSGAFSATTDGTARQRCVSSVFNAVTESDYEKGEVYLTSSSFTGGMVSLNGSYMKILEVQPGLGGSSNAIIDNIVTATGVRVAISGTFNFTIVRRTHGKIAVDGVYENITAAQLGTPRLENVPVSKRTGVVPTRMEMGNRVVCVGADFTASVAIAIGDVLTWSGATIDYPYSNNGVYRIDKVIDKETLQLVSEDWGPVLLNPITTSGTVGTFGIATDGVFVLDPFLRFANTTVYPVPVPTDVLEVLFLDGTTVRQAVDSDPAIFQGSLRFGQEVDDMVANAITQMFGPSATSIQGVLRGDTRLNLEQLNTKIDWEHYTYDEAEKAGSPALDTRSWGRHKDIRPDTINMWYWTPSPITTPRVILRGTGTRGHTDTNLTGDALLQVKNSSDQIVLQVEGDGRIHNLPTSGDIRTFMNVQANSAGYDGSLGSGLITGPRYLWKGVHSWSGTPQPVTGISLIGQHLGTYLDWIENPGDTYPRFTEIVGHRISMESTVNNAVFCTDMKGLDIVSNLLKVVDDHVDNQDAVTAMYGIHIRPTLAADFKIVNNHYGLKIEDITRAGTGTGGSGTNFALYTGAGHNYLGDQLQVLGDVLPGTDGNYDLGSSGTEWQDLYIDGTANIDILDVSVATSEGCHSLWPTADATYSLGYSGAPNRRWASLDLSGDSVAHRYKLDGLSTDSGVGTDWYPDGVSPRNLGSATRQWVDLYVDGVAYVDTLSLDTTGGLGVATSLNPTTSGKDLGNATYQWDDLYVDGVAYIDTLSLDTTAGLGVDTSLNPTTDDQKDLGSSSRQWKDLYVNGIAYIDTLSLDATAGLGVASHIIPTTDDTYALGSDAIKWSSVYSKYISIKGEYDADIRARGLDLSYTSSTDADGTRYGAYTEVHGGNSSLPSAISTSIAIFGAAYYGGRSGTGASSTYGTGIYGLADATNETTGRVCDGYGVRGHATGGTNTYGVEGVGETGSILNCGGDFTASGGTHSIGVQTHASDGSANTGVSAHASDGTDCYALKAYAQDSGNTYGVYSEAVDGTNTYGAYLSAYNGTQCYGAFCNCSGGTYNYGVYSEASGVSHAYAVDAQASGATDCRAVNAQASGAGTNNYGVYSTASGGTHNYAIYTTNGDVKLNASGGLLYAYGSRGATIGGSAALLIDTTTGEVGLTSSSIRVKKDIKDMGNTDWLYDLHPVTFRFKSNNVFSYGLIAEEVLPIAPDFVYYNPEKIEVDRGYNPEIWDRVEKDSESNKFFKQEMGGVHYDRFVPILINEIQKLRSRIAALENA
jgi:hypothetical protein